MKNQRLTLIEVVVVIALVVSLAVLTALGLKKARENARRGSCLNNLKCIGLSMRMYSNVYLNNSEIGNFPDKNGRTGLEMLALNGFLENTQIFTCPSTKDIIPDITHISSSSSYTFAGGMQEANSVDSSLMSHRRNNHKKYGNILFIDGHVKGYSGVDWYSNRGGSYLTDF